MPTVVGRGPIWKIMKLADFDNPCLVQESGTYLLYRPSYGQFCIPIPIFCCRGNSCPSETSCNDTIKLADTENPSGTEIWELSPTKNRVAANTAVRGPQRRKRFSLFVRSAPYLIWYRKRTIISDWRHSFVPVENPSYGVTSQNCDVLWPSGLKGNFTNSRSHLLYVPRSNKFGAHRLRVNISVIRCCFKL